jgi:hypothetical protein
MSIWASLLIYLLSFVPFLRAVLFLCRSAHIYIYPSGIFAWVVTSSTTLLLLFVYIVYIWIFLAVELFCLRNKIWIFSTSDYVNFVPLRIRGSLDFVHCPIFQTIRKLYFQGTKRVSVFRWREGDTYSTGSLKKI